MCLLCIFTVTRANTAIGRSHSEEAGFISTPDALEQPIVHPEFALNSLLSLILDTVGLVGNGHNCLKR